MAVAEMEIQAVASLVPEEDIFSVWHARQYEVVSLKELLDVYAFKFYLIGEMLRNLTIGLPPRNPPFDRPLGDDYKSAFKTNIQHVVNWCQEIRLHSVESYARTCLDNAEAGGSKFTRKSAEKMLEGLRERLHENLNTVSFKFMPRDSMFLYISPFPFGQKVLDNFPAASYDIEEASKCLALDRYTACVMHLMRVIEVALKAFGTGLNVMAQMKQAQSNWGTVLNVANREIERLNKSGDPTWTPEKRAFFEEIYAYLQAVRVAWRNPSMHADQKYDLPRAKRIYEAMKDLMRHMADHLDESGQFTP